MTVQLLMPGILWKVHATFASFYVGQNAPIIASLGNALNLKQDKFICLWGQLGAGRSHLLQAMCHLATQKEQSAIYLPLQELQKVSTQVFEDIENLDVICLDDVDSVAGKRDWEEAIFHLYNRLLASNRILIVTSTALPKDIPWLLPDLGSRLMACTPFLVHSLTDEEKLAALQLSATERGFSLPEEVGQFLLRRYSRQTTNLFNALDKLDHASLTVQRRLTVPFAKSVLGL